MADKNIGSLEAVQQLNDDDLLVLEAQGEAKQMSGKVLKNYAQQSVQAQVGEVYEQAAIVKSYARQVAENALNASERASAAASYAMSAESARDGAIEASGNYPYIDSSSGNWMVWDAIAGTFIDTGVSGIGKGLVVLDFYPSLSELEITITSPEPGAAYGVGESAPYDIYIYSASRGWVNNGKLQGAQGEIGPAGPQGIQGITGEPGPAGAQGEMGEPGKSAYESAKEGGYTGTEAEFYADLAAIQNIIGAAEGVSF